MNAARPHVRQSGGRVTETVDLSRHQALLLAVLVFVPVPLLTLGGLAVPFPELAQRALAPLLPFVAPPDSTQRDALEESRLFHALAVVSSPGDFASRRGSAQLGAPVTTPALDDSPVSLMRRFGEVEAGGVLPASLPSETGGTGAVEDGDPAPTLDSPIGDSQGSEVADDGAGTPSSSEPIGGASSGSAAGSSGSSSGSSGSDSGSSDSGSSDSGSSGSGGSGSDPDRDEDREGAGEVGVQPPAPLPPPPAPPPPPVPSPGTETPAEPADPGTGTGSGSGSGSGGGNSGRGNGNSGSGENGNGNGSGSGSGKGKTREAVESIVDATVAVVGDLLGTT
jgi:hypothetical protein